jgi:hypothetical protein
MLNPKNNFLCEASIPPVPRLRLHPALIGGWRETGGEAGREAERDAGREAGGGRLGERLGEGGFESRALRSIETGRESRILRGFDHFEALTHAANHASYEVSIPSTH